MKKIFAFGFVLGLMACSGNVTSNNTEDAIDSTEIAAFDTVSVDTLCIVDTVVVAE